MSADSLALFRSISEKEIDPDQEYGQRQQGKPVRCSKHSKWCMNVVAEELHIYLGAPWMARGGRSWKQM